MKSSRFAASHVTTHGPVPTLDREARLWARGYRCVAGLDEVGRGAWAGPVVAAAVVLPRDDPDLVRHLCEVRDSKQLTAHQRDAIVGRVHQHSVAWSVGVVPGSEIDSVGIVAATRRAMFLALSSLGTAADALLIDHLALPEVPLPQDSLPKGDALVLSIAAASIIAKVCRDRLMVDMESHYPGYGFARHKGYGTKQHRAALMALGPCAIHRASFKPIRDMVERRGRAEDGNGGGRLLATGRDDGGCQ